MEAGVTPSASGKVQGEDGERDAHGALADELGLGVQPQASLSGDLDEIVQEANQPHADHEEQQDQGRRRGARGRRIHHPHDEVRQPVAQQDGAHHHGSAHGGRAALGVVGGRSVIADELAVALADQQADKERGSHQGEQQGKASADQ